MPEHSKIIEDSAQFQRSLFGRKRGRPLTGVRADAMKTVMPTLEIPDNRLDGQGKTDPQSFFSDNYKSFILEIGFGQGERLAQHMKECPDTGFFGAEPFLNGMAAFLEYIRDEKKPNVRVFMGDGMRIVKTLHDNALDAIYVLNPDPWHKVRHHKRRIINQNNLSAFSRILKPDGMLIMSTDVPELTNWMITHASLHPDFTWQAHKESDWSHPPENWIPTRYETKGAKGAKKMSYLIFKKTCKS